MLFHLISLQNRISCNDRHDFYINVLAPLHARNPGLDVDEQLGDTARGQLRGNREILPRTEIVDSCSTRLTCGRVPNYVFIAFVD